MRRVRMKSNARRRALMACAALALSGCDSVPKWAMLDFSGSDDAPRLEGTRQSLTAAKPELAADIGTAGAPFTLPPMAANPDWEQHSGKFNFHTAHLALAGDLSHEHSASMGDGESFNHTLVPRPVVADGRVYAMDAQGVVSAHDVADIGRVLWTSKGVSQESEDDTLGGGLAFAQGVVYVSSGRGLVVALDAATGAEKWRRSLGLPLRSSPRVGANKVFVISLDNQAFALNVSDGEIAWAHRGIAEAAGIMNSISPTVAGDKVVVPYSSGQVYVLSAADGQEIWSDSLSRGSHTQASSNLSGIGGDPLVDGEVVISVSSGGTMAVQALDSGKRVWEKQVGALNAPWVAGEWLFVLSTDNQLIAMKKYDGKIRWVTQLRRFEDEEGRKDPITWRGPVLASGNLIVVSSEGTLLQVSADTGAVVSTREVPDDVFTAPVVAGGQVFLVNKDARLTALQ